MAWTMLGEKPFSTQYITNNQYYNLGTIKVSNIVLHSVGVGSSRSTEDWRNAWNKSSSTNNVHAVVGPTEGIIMLPSFEQAGKGMKAAGCGKGSTNLSFNSSALQVEMQEYKAIKYTGGANFVTSDMDATVQYQLDVLDTAIQWMANVCIFHNLDPLKPGVLVSHREAHQIYNKASNHADVTHLFNQLPAMNMSMDKVRQLVAKRVEEYKLEKELSMLSTEQFDALMDSWLSRQAQKPCASWSKADMEWAKSQGLLAGDTSGNLMPYGLTDRQTLAAVLHRYNEKFDGGKK